MKKKKNERNAGRKKLYNVETKVIKVPIVLEKEIKKLCEPYLNKTKTDE